MRIINDPFFKLVCIEKTERPQTVVYLGLHQSNSYQMVAVSDPEANICMDGLKLPSEDKAGQIAVKRLLAGDRGHYNVFRHVQIVFNFGYIPHSVIAQITRHVHISFTIQSFRYTGQQFKDVNRDNVEQYFYLRPVGFYSDREGNKYEYTNDHRQSDIDHLLYCVYHYNQKIDLGMPYEQARGLLPYDLRQHGVMTVNGQALMHLLDVRYKANAQIEAVTFASMVLDEFKRWMPEISEWYVNERLGKARLAP